MLVENGTKNSPDEATFFAGPSKFQPLHMFSECEFSVRVWEDGHSILLTVNWTNPLVNLQHLHQKWLTSKSFDLIEMYHPKVIGFEQFFKKCRTWSTDNLESTATFVLPIQVQTYISEKYSLV